MYKPIPTDIVTVSGLQENKYTADDLFLVIGYQQVYQDDELIVLLDPFKNYVMTSLTHINNIIENVSISDLLWAKEAVEKQSNETNCYSK